MPAKEKAFLESEKKDRIPCLFNPAELQIARANRWEASAVPGRGAPDLFFTGGRSGTLRMTLTFDTTDSGQPVTSHTNTLLALMDVDPRLPGHDASTGRGRPPWVRFHWGDLHSFKAVLEDLELDFTYFSSGGVPLRARAALSLRQFEQEAVWGAQNPTSGTPEPHRRHRVQVGETLDRIAAVEYGDPTRWRLIADANGIVDPLRLVPGTLLAVPRPKERHGA